MTRSSSSILTLTTLAALGGCGASAPTPVTPEAEAAEAPAEASGPPAQPEALLADLEERLLGAPSIRLQAQITASGALSADLEGRALITDDQRASLDFEGTFDGQSVHLGYRSDGSLHSGGQLEGGDLFAEASPPAVSGGLLIGLTRMGLLHNLAMLSGGEPPDHTDGTAARWVTLSEVTAGPVEIVDDVRAQPLSFRITVDGQLAAEATLWLDEATALPLRRRQLVHFDEGEMEVLERYLVFELDVDLEGERFDVGAPGCPAAR